MAKKQPTPKVFKLLVTQEQLHMLMYLVTDNYFLPEHRELSRSIALQIGKQGGSSYKGSYIGVITTKAIDSGRADN